MGSFTLSTGEIQESFTTNCSRSTANTKGAYAQLVASTTFAYTSISMQINGSSGSGGGDSYLVDLAVGGAGSESVVVPNILCDTNRGIGMNDVNIELPIAIPAGSRVAVRCQEPIGAGTRQAEVQFSGRSGGFNYGRMFAQVASTYGALTASTNGTLVDQGAVTNTYGTYAQLTASTNNDHNVIVIVMGTDLQTANLGGWYNFQLAVGGAGSEVNLCEFQSSTNTNDTRMQTNTYTYRGHIPAGSRLSTRAKCTQAAATDRHATAILIGI